jgi:hypothetical protein
MYHMRVRASLTAADARAILEFLKGATAATRSAAVVNPSPP